MTNNAYRNILVVLLTASVFFNAIVGGINYQLKHKLVKKETDLNITMTSLVLLEEAFNNLNDQCQDMNTIQGVIYEAGKHFKIDPLLLTELIKSESNFRPFPKHKLKHVIGMSGINVKEHLELLQYNPYSVKGNIWASAQILDSYNKDGNMTKAIAKYKGYSKEGIKQANEVLASYYQLKGIYE